MIDKTGIILFLFDKKVASTLDITNNGVYTLKDLKW